MEWWRKCSAFTSSAVLDVVSDSDKSSTSAVGPLVGPQSGHWLDLSGAIGWTAVGPLVGPQWGHWSDLSGAIGRLLRLVIVALSFRKSVLRLLFAFTRRAHPSCSLGDVAYSYDLVVVAAANALSDVQTYARIFFAVLLFLYMRVL